MSRLSLHAPVPLLVVPLPVVSLLVAPLLLATLCSVASSAQAAPKPGPWTLVGTTDGVTVHTRKLPGYPVPQMKGVVTLDASIFEVFAVLDDTARHKAWMAKTSGSAFIQANGGEGKPWDRIIWTRKKTPWPAQDRDAVLQVTVTVDGPGKQILSRFRAIKTPLKPKLSGVTRMPRLDGSFRLRALSPTRTRVTYLLLADMGGWIPDWLTRLISRKLPLRDLQGMRKQLVKTRGRYAAFLKRVDPLKGGTMPIYLQPKPASLPPGPGGTPAAGQKGSAAPGAGTTQDCPTRPQAAPSAKPAPGTTPSAPARPAGQRRP